jgi:ABC-type sugar transport system ATPase subunit
MVRKLIDLEVASARIQADEISKTFGPVQALSNVSLKIFPGEVHTLAGENGSGKSTLMRIIGGVIQPDSGSISVEGHQQEFDNVRAAMRQGVTIVSQELSLVPALSVAENIFLGHQQVRDRAGINWSKTQIAASKLLERLNLSIDTSVPVGTLPQDQQQLVEIARALAFDSKVILFDEPTSSLEPAEVESLFTVMRQLRSEGVALVFISHRMREMTEISDRYSVLRDGKLVDTAPATEVDSEWIIERMVLKKKLDNGTAQTHKTTNRETAQGIVQIENLRDRKGRVNGVSLELFSGEIAGFAGLAGAGRTELVETIVGYRHRSSGTVRVLGQEVGPSTKAAVAAGLSLVPDDRRMKSSILDMSVRDNLLLSVRGGLGQRRNKATETQVVEQWIEKLQIKTQDLNAPLKTLSGGNQQKVIIARCLQVSPKLLILDEPTRGIDLGARAEIHELLKVLASEGLSVLVVSSELDEILQISDRVMVMHGGLLVADLAREEASEQQIIAAATGHLD